MTSLSYEYTVYRKDTGEFISRGRGTKTSFQTQKMNPDHVVYEGDLTETHYYDPVDQDIKPLAEWDTVVQAARGRIVQAYQEGDTIELDNLPECEITLNERKFTIADGIARIRALQAGRHLIQLRVPGMKIISEIIEVAP